MYAPRGFARGGKPGITFRIDQFEPAVLSALAELDPREILDCDHGPDEVAELSARVARLDPPFDPPATALTYQVFLADILPHREVVDYVRRLSGYVATGEATDETVHMFHGIGGNGKGKFLGLYVDVLGDGEYAATVPAELVADSGGERHPTERVCMRGARLAVCEQTADGEALNAKGVKNLPGVVWAQRVRCGKPACHCARGPGHLAYHRFWREGGRLRKCYVRRADLATVRAACDARRQEYRELTEARQQ